MRGYRAGWALAFTFFFVAPLAFAQSAANPFDMPELRKYWNPVVGAGVVYQVRGTDGKKRTEEFAITSEETLEGKKAYWLEVAEDGPNPGTKVYAKTLVIPTGFEARKLIIQLPGIGAMEMPVAPVAQSANADTNNAAKLVGTETITVPGGTFECEHWREADGSEVWESAKVGPLQIVKKVDKYRTRVLVKTISHAKDYVTGTVKPYDPEAIRKFTGQLASQ
jgi:hypothetical protein